MKGKNVWTVRYYCEYNELDSLAQFLEKKLSMGWEMTHKSGVTYGFRKVEPRRGKISVEIVDADGDKEEKQRFIEYCEADGWKHIFDDGLLQFFEHEDMDADPIHSDEVIKLKTVHRKCLTHRGISNIAIGFLCVLYVLHGWWSMHYYDYYHSNLVVSLIGIPLMLVFVIVSIGDYFLWYRRAKDALERGKSPIYRRSKISKLADYFIIGYIVFVLLGGSLMDAFYSGVTSVMLYSVGMVTFLGLFIIGSDFYWTKNTVDRKVHQKKELAIGIMLIILVSFVGYFIIGAEENTIENGPVRISVEELGVTGDGTSERWVEKEGSPLGQHEQGYDREGTMRISYDWYSTKLDSVYQMTLENSYFTWDTQYEEVVEPAFNADKVYLMGQAVGLTQYLLLYPEDIVYIETTIDLTDTQKEAIGAKFVE